MPLPRQDHSSHSFVRGGASTSCLRGHRGRDPGSRRGRGGCGGRGHGRGRPASGRAGRALAVRLRRGWDRARGRQRPRRPGPGPRSSPGQTKVAAAGRGRPQPRTPGGGLAWPRSPLPSRATVAVRRGRDRLRGRDAVAAVAAVAVVGAVAVFALLAGVVAAVVALGGTMAAFEARALWSPPVAGRVRVRRRSRRGLARAIQASCRRGPGSATAAEVVTEGGARRRGRGRGGLGQIADSDEVNYICSQHLLEICHATQHLCAWRCRCADIGSFS